MNPHKIKNEEEFTSDEINNIVYSETLQSSSSVIIKAGELHLQKKRDVERGGAKWIEAAFARRRNVWGTREQAGSVLFHWWKKREVVVGMSENREGLEFAWSATIAFAEFIKIFSSARSFKLAMPESVQEDKHLTFRMRETNKRISPPIIRFFLVL